MAGPTLTGVPSALEVGRWDAADAHFIYAPLGRSPQLVRTTARSVVERAQQILGSARTGAWSDDLSNRMDSALRQRGLPALPAGPITREHLRALLWIVTAFSDGSRSPGDVIWLPRTITGLPQRNVALPAGAAVWRVESLPGVTRTGAAGQTPAATTGGSSGASSSSGSSSSSSASSGSSGARPPARPAASTTQASALGGWKGFVVGTVAVGVAALGLRALQKRDAMGPMPPPRPTYPTRATRPERPALPARAETFEGAPDELTAPARRPAPSSSSSRARALLGS